MRRRWPPAWPGPAVVVADRSHRPTALLRPVLPMPGLVDDAVRVVARIAHDETETAGMRGQPCEGGCALEGLLGRRLSRCADIQRVAAVVFAVTGCGVDGEDPAYVLAAGELAF